MTDLNGSSCHENLYITDIIIIDESEKSDDMTGTDDSAEGNAESTYTN